MKSIAIRNFKDNISLKFYDENVEIKITENKKVDNKSTISISTTYISSRKLFKHLLHTAIEVINKKEDRSIPTKNGGSIRILYINKYNIVISYSNDTNEQYQSQVFTENRLKVLVGCILNNIN